MQQVYIPMEQCWENLQEAIEYFKKVIDDLEVLKGLPILPTDLYLSVRTGEEDLDDYIISGGTDIVLRNL